ncbi:anti-repressor SinI family protein [Gracilibacillus sp. HCP3S3_G5_1]
MAIKVKVDYEWLYLIAKAKEKGYTLVEVREFLNKSKSKSNVQQN